MKTTKLRLEREFYKVPSLRQAARAFADLAEVKVTVLDARSVEVDIRPTDAETSSIVADEYLNHALALAIGDRG